MYRLSSSRPMVGSIPTPGFPAWVAKVLMSLGKVSVPSLNLSSRSLIALSCLAMSSKPGFPGSDGVGSGAGLGWVAWVVATVAVLTLGAAFAAPPRPRPLVCAAAMVAPSEVALVRVAMSVRFCAAWRSSWKLSSRLAIWDSYSARNVVIRFWPQTSGVLTPMVPASNNFLSILSTYCTFRETMYVTPPG